MGLLGLAVGETRAVALRVEEQLEQDFLAPVEEGSVSLEEPSAPEEDESGWAVAIGADLAAVAVAVSAVAG